MDSDTFVIEEHQRLPHSDVQLVKDLFDNTFPLRYGDQFYNSLKRGNYSGKPLLTCIARKNGRLIGAACATKEYGYHETRVVESGTCTYLMTLAVEPR